MKEDSSLQIRQTVQRGASSCQKQTTSSAQSQILQFQPISQVLGQRSDLSNRSLYPSYQPVTQTTIHSIPQRLRYLLCETVPPPPVVLPALGPAAHAFPPHRVDHPILGFYLITLHLLDDGTQIERHHIVRRSHPLSQLMEEPESFGRSPLAPST